MPRGIFNNGFHTRSCAHPKGGGGASEAALAAECGDSLMTLFPACAELQHRAENRIPKRGAAGRLPYTPTHIRRRFPRHPLRSARAALGG